MQKLVSLLLVLLCCSCGPKKIATDGPWWDVKHAFNATAKTESTYSSRYLTMRDGVRIATDLYLPSDLKDGEKVPTIFLQTRYYRAFNLRWPLSAAPNRVSSLFRLLEANRYAIVLIDTRGSGASFGSISSPWSPDEVRDGAEVLDWIVNQPWSNGKVGATGVSYDGTAAEMLATTKHPALKAVIPRFSLFDCYTDIAFPGGIHHSWFTRVWGAGNKALDSGRPSDLGGWMQKIFVLGVVPVENDKDGKMLEWAIAEHANNHDVEQDALHITYRDDKTERGVGFDEFCPDGHVQELIDSRVPFLGYSGWFDGAYANSAIKRFLTVRTPGSRLLLGPWDHGGRQNISHFSPSTESDFPHAEEMLRFFDYHLKGTSTGIEKEPPIHYFTMGEERWKSSNVWPPEGFRLERWNLGEHKTLTKSEEDADADEYKVDFSATTGDSARWNSPYNPDRRLIRYPNRKSEDEKLLIYDSNPLTSDLAITGHPILNISLESSRSDGALFVYLEDVDPDGAVHHVTEGQLRLLHRHEVSVQPRYNFPGIGRTFERKDAESMPEGKIESFRLDLLPTSYLYKSGHRIRIAIGGADAAHFARIPNSGDVKYKIHHNSQHSSFLELPAKNASGQRN